MIGQTLKHYDIEAELGRGGMGEVYLANDTKLNRQVALKILRTETASEPERLKRFEREVKTLASLSHPNIVTIYSVEEVNDIHFFTMELVRGKSLSELIPTDGLPLQNFFSLTVPLTDALRVAHEQGITHRDLKPDNIIVCEDGRIKILDFGLAKLKDTSGEPFQHADIDTDSMTGEGVVIGTVAYMSPEQAQGKEVDPRSDIFSLGILLYQMITGHHPFHGENSIEIISSILRDTPKAITDYKVTIPPPLWEITQKCLNKDPDMRYQSSSDLHTELTALKDDFDSGKLERLMCEPVCRELSTTKSRFTKYIPFLAVLFVIILLFLFYKSQNRDEVPVPTLLSSGRPTIAVLAFEDLTGSDDLKWLSRGLSSMLVTGLAQTPGLNIISNQRIYELLNKYSGNENLRMDKQAISEISRRSGASAVVYGSIFKMEDDIRIDAQIEDVSSGHLLTAYNVRGRDVFQLVDDLVLKIRKSFDLTTIRSHRSISDITTDSIKAYQLYSEGLQARMGLRIQKAKELFLEAIRLDPNFAMAYFELSRLGSIDENKSGKSQVELYRKKVIENLDRLSERQQLLVQGYYSLEKAKTSYLSMKKGEHINSAKEKLEKLVAEFPDEEDAYILLSQIYLEYDDDLQKGIKLLEKGVETLPKSGLMRNQYAYFLTYMGRYDEAFQSLEIYAKIQPDEPNPYDSLGETYLKAGQPAKAVEYYSKALEIDPTFSTSYAGRIYANAMMGNYDFVFADFEKTSQIAIEAGYSMHTIHSSLASIFLSSLGKYREAVKLSEDSLDYMTKNGDIFEEAWLHLILASIHLDYNQVGKAKKHSDKAIQLIEKPHGKELISHVPVLTFFMAGLVETRAGDLETAHDHLASIKDIYDAKKPKEKFWFYYLDGEIKLAGQKYEDAWSAFNDAEPKHKLFFSPSRLENAFDHQLSFRDGKARVKKALGDIKAAIAIYNDLVTPSLDDVFVTPLIPRFVLEIARLQAQIGHTEKALKNYKQFLKLWSHADKDLPELAEAQEYIALNNSGL